MSLSRAEQLNKLERDAERLKQIADAYDDLTLWAPRQAGHAAAVRRFLAFVGQVLDREGSS